MTTVSIMGPSIFSWAGLYGMMLSSDIFVLYDDQPYTRNDRSNRNTLFTTRDKTGYITIPYRHNGSYNTSYDQLFLLPSKFNLTKFMRGYSMTYSGFPGYQFITNFLSKLPFDQHQYPLIDFQIDIFRLLSDFIPLPEIVLSSTLPYQQLSSNSRVSAILNHLNATTYLSAFTSYNYNSCYNHGCTVMYQYFTYSPYLQPSKLFVKNLSFLDVISCIGIEAFSDYCHSCNSILSCSERSTIT